MEETVEFWNAGGCRLSGIIHMPSKAGQAARPGVVFLQAGLKDRVGAHRLYVKLARRLCAEGFTVLRFDAHGTGDSEGSMPEGLSTDNFILIEKGEFVEDALSAVDFFTRKTGITKVILLGLCGGAVTAAIAAGRDRRVDTLVLLDPNVTLDEAANAGKIHPSNAVSGFRSYAVKLVHPSDWLRFLTLQTDYSELWKILRSYLRVQYRCLLKNSGQDPLVMDRQLNKYFLKGFNAFLARRKKVLFILAEKSPAAWDFKAKFEKDVLSKGQCRRACEVVTVRNANHEFAALDAQKTLTDTVVRWMNGGMAAGIQ